MSDELARLRALAEKAANPELDHWQRTHALWELRAALSPPVVLGLLDAADRAEAAERDDALLAIKRNNDDLRARAEAAERELASVLSDWNAVRDASGSKTNGGLAGHVAQLRARAERLAEALRLFLALDPTFESATDDELRDIAGRKYYPSQKLAQAVIAARAALADPAPEVKP